MAPLFAPIAMLYHNMLNHQLLLLFQNCAYVECVIVIYEKSISPPHILRKCMANKFAESKSPLCSKKPW